MNTEKNEHWERLSAVLEYADGMSINYFSHYIGLTSSEGIYRIKRNMNRIGLYLAQRIVLRFPEIDIEWLLTGKGEMLRKR